MYEAEAPQMPTGPMHMLLDAAVGLFDVSGFSKIADRLEKEEADGGSTVRTCVCGVRDLFSSKVVLKFVGTTGMRLLFCEYCAGWRTSAPLKGDKRTTYSFNPAMAIYCLPIAARVIHQRMPPPQLISNACACPLPFQSAVESEGVALRRKGTMMPEQAAALRRRASIVPEPNRGIDRLGSKKLSTRHNSVASGLNLTDSGCV